MFVVGADGLVLSAKNNSDSGVVNPMNAFKAGDSIVVPRRRQRLQLAIGRPSCKPRRSLSIALTVAYIHP